MEASGNGFLSILISKIVIKYNNLAYGSCARCTSGSQNLGVLPKRPDNSFLFAINKTKDSE